MGSLIANEIISWRKVKSLFSYRLLALDKQPGVRAVGIDETLLRLLEKEVAALNGDDLAYVFGLQHIAREMSRGNDGWTHGLRVLFEKKILQWV